MHTEKRRLALLVGHLFAAGTLFSLSTTGMAQQPAPSERVTVTGTNIPRAQTETASPVISISRDQIENSGKTTVAEYLQTLSVDGQGSLPTSFGNGFAAGSTAISLRGMGATSTLVLINGRRVAPYGRADDGQKVFTDLSAIPIELVDRIEILMDGASAIYGADAIAGVVNILLRESFVGTVGQASYATSQDGEGKTPKISLAHGFGDLAKDGYNFMFNAEYFKSDQIFARDINRDWVGKGDLRPWGYGLESAGGFNRGNNPTSNARRHATPVGAVRAAAGGAYTALPGACSQFSRTADQTGVAAGGCLYYDEQFRSLQPEIESINLYGRGTWRLSGDTKVYAELGWSQKKTDFFAGPGGPSVTPTVFSPMGAHNYATGSPLTPILLMSAAHPDNPLGVPARLRYGAFDVGPDERTVDNQAIRAVVGIKGRGWGWDYDAAYSHSEADMELVFKNGLNMAVVRAALSDPASPFFPYRVGVNAGLNPASLYAAMRVDLKSTNKTSMDILDIRASRELMQLDGGPLGLAVGAEYRKESFDQPAFPGTENGSVSASFVGAKGKQEILAAYLEVLAPLTKWLELSAAVRHDKYDNFDSTTPKFGVKLTPVRQLALRGTYSEGFRAPNATEFNTASQSAGTAVAPDPVRCPGGVPAPGANAGDCNQSFAAIVSGTPTIQPEKSKGTTLGLVWDPLPNTSLSLDWWTIERKGEINPPTFTNLAAQNPCTQVRLDDNLVGIPCSGTLLGVFAPYENTASSNLRGVDVGFRQRFNLKEYGKLTFDLRWSHLSSFLRKETDGSSVEFAGTHGNCDISNCIGTPKDKVNMSLTWEQGAWRVTGLVNWRSSFENKFFKGDPAGCAVAFANGDDAPGGCKIASFWTMDLSGRWQVQKNLTVFGSISNLFDKVAPIDPLTYGSLGYNPVDYSGAIGRVFTIGGRYQFN